MKINICRQSSVPFNSSTLRTLRCHEMVIKFTNFHLNFAIFISFLPSNINIYLSAFCRQHFIFFCCTGMKVWRFIVAISLLLATDALMRTRFRAMKCSSNETLVSMKCFLKAYSRNYVTINSVETRKVQYEKPIEVCFFSFAELNSIQNDLQFKIKISGRHGTNTIYQEVFRYKFEWCSFIDGTTDSIVANTLVTLVKKSSPQLIAPCPLVPVSARTI